MKRHTAVIVMLLLVAASGCNRNSSPPTPAPPRSHPIFQTQLTGSSANRPAVLVDVLDDSRGWFRTAKLYLTVQSSAFPEGTWVILPVNVGDFSGCRARFVQLPFEVHAGDNLVFNLLDDRRLTVAQEERIIKACRLAGYCIAIAGTVYSPEIGPLVAPTVTDAATLLGDAIVEELSIQNFRNMGTAEFIAPLQLPGRPHEANRLTLLDDSNYARVHLRIYGPQQSLTLREAEHAARKEWDCAGSARLLTSRLAPVPLASVCVGVTSTVVRQGFFRTTSQLPNPHRFDHLLGRSAL